MFNQIRTLLMNINGDSSCFEDVPGDQLIPEEYRQVKLPTYLNVVRARLFGSSPDRAMLNYKVNQLLQLIDATDLRGYITAEDPRITYTVSNFFEESWFKPQLVEISDTSDEGSFIVTGKGSAPDKSGISRYRYYIEADSSSITIRRINWPTRELTETLVFNDNLSEPVPLPYSGYSIRVRLNNLPASCTVNGFLRPTVSLLDTLDGTYTIGEPYLLQLFGLGEEPYATFKNCWSNHPDFAYRLSGFVLALAYRTAEVQNA